MNKAELIDVLTEKMGSDRRQATAAVENERHRGRFMLHRCGGAWDTHLELSETAAKIV